MKPARPTSIAYHINQVLYSNSFPTSVRSAFPEEIFVFFLSSFKSTSVGSIFPQIHVENAPCWPTAARMHCRVSRDRVVLSSSWESPFLQYHSLCTCEISTSQKYDMHREVQMHEHTTPIPHREPAFFKITVCASARLSTSQKSALR
jgi:hypothetical protein